MPDLHDHNKYVFIRRFFSGCSRALRSSSAGASDPWRPAFQSMIARIKKLMKLTVPCKSQDGRMLFPSPERIFTYPNISPSGTIVTKIKIWREENQSPVMKRNIAACMNQKREQRLPRRLSPAKNSRDAIANRPQTENDENLKCRGTRLLDHCQPFPSIESLKYCIAAFSLCSKCCFTFGSSSTALRHGSVIEYSLIC